MQLFHAFLFYPLHFFPSIVLYLFFSSPTVRFSRCLPTLFFLSVFSELLFFFLSIVLCFFLLHLSFPVYVFHSFVLSRTFSFSVVLLFSFSSLSSFSSLLFLLLFSLISCFTSVPSCCCEITACAQAVRLCARLIVCVFSPLDKAPAVESWSNHCSWISSPINRTSVQVQNHDIGSFPASVLLVTPLRAEL